MRATILATVVLALAAGVDAKQHNKKRQCKPKHKASVSSTAAAPVDTVPASSAAVAPAADPSADPSDDSAELYAMAEAAATASTTVTSVYVTPSASSTPASQASAVDETFSKVSPSGEAASPVVDASSAAPTAASSEAAAPSETAAPSSSAALTADAAAAETTTTTTTSSAAAQATNSAGEVWPAASEPAATSPTSMQQTLVDLHNSIRAQFSASALVWDQDLADFAAGHADACVFQHSASPPRTGGENLSAMTDATIPALFQMWADEGQYYNWDSPSFTGLSNQVIGHWTQIVWKETTKVGCAWKTCADGTIFTGYGDSEFLVCEYYPAGNIIGNTDAETASLFSANIGPKA